MNLVKKKKEIVSIVMLSLIFIFIIVLWAVVLGNFNSYADKEKDINYYELTVNYGDSMWSIAKKITPDNMDIRNTIYIICDYNDLETEEIYAGQVLKVPEFN